MFRETGRYAENVLAVHRLVDTLLWLVQLHCNVGKRFVTIGRAVVRTLVHGHKVLLVAAAALAGGVAPVAGDALAPLATPIVVFLVYGSLRDARSGGGLTPSPATVAACLCISYVALPTVAALLGRAFLSTAVTTGVLVAVAAPTTAGSAIVWTRLGDGDTGLAAVVALVSILLSPLVTPTILSITLMTAVSLDVTVIVRKLLIIVCGAVALAWLTAGRSPREIHLQHGSLAAIVALVYISVASSDFDGIATTFLGEVALAALAIVCIGLVVVLVGGTAVGLGRRRLTAVFFSSDLKNLGIALTVASSLDIGAGPAVSVTVFYVVQQLASGLVAEGFRPR